MTLTRSTRAMGSPSATVSPFFTRYFVSFTSAGMVISSGLWLAS